MKKRILSGIGACMVLLCSLLFSVSAAAADLDSTPYVTWNLSFSIDDNMVSVPLSHVSSSSFNGVGYSGAVDVSRYSREEKGADYVVQAYNFSFNTNIQSFIIHASDFYAWNWHECESASSENVLASFLSLYDFSGSFENAVVSYEASYSELGSNEIMTDSGYFGLEEICIGAPSSFYNEFTDKPVHYHDFEITISNIDVNALALDAYISTSERDAALDLRSKDQAPAEISKLGFADYTSWIATAVGGFLDFELFPGFTFGGILMVFIAFSCVMWFLRLVSGG